MTKNYVFTLKEVNTEKIDQRFNITIISNINTIDDKNPFNTTRITDLSTHKTTPEIISFLDESRKPHKCSISMIDFESGEELCFDYKSYNCFWCRNPIPKNFSPIGIPIRYVPNQATKTYYSEISKDIYSINENICSTDNNTDKRIVVKEYNYYLTDGVVCSWNCCMSYIEDNYNNSMYDMSEMLVLKMYTDLYPNKTPVIIKAPHWRKLKEYGGDLTIEKFRDSFNKIEYKEYGQFNPKFKSVGVLFEEKLKF